MHNLTNKMRMTKAPLQSQRRFTDLYRRLTLELCQDNVSTQLRLTRQGANAGKLQFYAERPFDLAKSSQIKASLDKKSLSLHADVISCRPKSHFFIIELDINQDNMFKARLFLQLAAIANYKHHADIAGHTMTFDQAACEWIDLYAEKFAAEFDRRIRLKRTPV